VEVMGEGGGGLYFGPSRESLPEVETDKDFDGSQPYWLCWYLDAFPCFRCGAVDLAVADLEVLLERGGGLPHSDLPCPACAGSCRGPQGIECDGVPGVMLAFLKPQYGAPLFGRLCVSCGLVWLTLHPEDAKARTELARRFPDSGPCPRCARGRLRVTGLDVPYSGFACVDEPGSSGRDRRVARLLAAVCDVCGEASPRVEPKPQGGPASPYRK
jgi:hypothetical protein